MNKSTITALKRAGIAMPKGPEEPGTLIAGFFVPGRPAPWTPPRVSPGRPALKCKRLVAWQKTVKVYASLAMAGVPPYSHPVRLVFRFDVKRRPGIPPDLSNLNKGTEDALQGIVIVNDTQVNGIDSGRRLYDGEGVTIHVYSAEGD